MSTKTTKKSTVSSSTTKSKSSTRSSVEPSEAAATATSPTRAVNMASSPASPTRLSRIQERNELQNLNDRLISYINRVKYLEAENDALFHQVQITEETVTRESTTVISNYKNELESLRQSLDIANKGKAASQLECSKLSDEISQLKQKLAKSEKDRQTSETHVSGQQSEIKNLKDQLAAQLSESKKTYKELKDFKADYGKLQEEFKRIKAELESEILCRISLTDENQSLQDRLKFEDDLHQQKMEHISRSVIETEVETQLKKQYDYDMTEAIKEVRQQFMVEVENMKNDYELKNKAELNNATARVSDYSNQAQTLRDDLKNCNGRVESLVIKLTEFEKENTAIKAQMKDCDDKINVERRINSRRLVEKDDQITQLRNELDKLLKELNDLMDIKLSLDFEIATYRKILDGEESRLNISAETSGVQRGTPHRRTPLRGKRKRTYLADEMSADYSSSSTSKGDIEVNDQDVDGKFVKLFNKGEKDINIGGWQILKTADGKDTTFKFHRSVTIKAGAYVTVWSADAGATHSPPTTVVMKGQKWFTGEKSISTLLNNDGEEVAIRETSRKLISSSIVHSSGANPEGDGRCAIM